MLGEFNFNSGAAKDLFPIYQQMNEPVKKDGLWIKTSNKLKNIFIGNENETMTQEWVKLNDLPYKTTDATRSTIINNIVYMIGTYSNGNNILTYDIQSDLYTNIPITITASNGACASVGTDIYMFGSKYKEENRVVKYDTLTNTLTQLGTSPITLKQCGAVAIGTDIYVFGIGSDYKYDTLTGTFTSINAPRSSYDITKPVAISTSIYKMGGVSNDSFYGYEYDITTNTYTQITLPYHFYGAVAKLNKGVYLIGGLEVYSSGSSQKMSVYDTLTKTFTSSSDLPEAYNYGVAEAKDTNIYFFNANHLYQLKGVLEYEPGIYLFLNLYDESGVGGFVLNDLHKNIKKIYLFSETEKLNYETYIGDGTSWNLIEGEN